MQNDFPMPITAPRIVLRPPVIEDAPEYFQAVTESINELRCWLPWAKYFPSITQAEQYIRECNANWIIKTNNDIGLSFLITEKESGKILGNIVIWNIMWGIPKFEFGFWVRTAEVNKGYVSEAVNALARYCFLKLNVKRIEIRCEKNNTPVLAVSKHLGFDLDGILHSSTIAVSNGKITDTTLFSCTDINKLPKLEVKWGQLINE